jgi:soluble lytic murein transglycosylase-like protein
MIRSPARRSTLFTTALLCGLLAMLTPVAPAATLERPDATLRGLLIEAIESSDSFADRFDAEVWLTDMSRRLSTRVEDPGERLSILKTVHYEARRAGLEPELILAVIQVESNYDRFAISSAGARGLMQIMPFWLQEIGHPEDNLFDINTNVRFGCTILSYYLEREDGNLYRALARYNGSVGKRWYPNLVFRALGSRWYKQ